jgi:CoA:oxalate CoA-transferase
MRPLENIKVLDFTIAVAGPMGSMMLCDMGAEVIKIERVNGEPQRQNRPAGMDDTNETAKQNESPDSGAWMQLNRGKKDLAIDIRTPKGKEIILKLAETTDVVLESFRPGVMDRLGLGYKTISKINPKVIYCSFSGYGETGPVAQRAGGDMWSQAMSGMISVMGYPGGAPQMANFAPVDHASGMLIAYSVMTALYVRERTGLGQKVTLNNLSAAIYLQFAFFGMNLIEGKMPFKSGRRPFDVAPPFGPYRAKDGDVMTIFGSGPFWPDFCRLIGLEDLIDDPRFNSDEARTRNSEELDSILDEAFSKKTREEWRQMFKKARMRCDPCLTYDEICSHTQMQENQMIYRTKHPVRGEMSMLGNPIKLQKTPSTPQGPSPLLGQHTVDILLSLGYTEKEIVDLESESIIRTTRPAKPSSFS